MKAFKDFFHDDDIIFYLCKIRAKQAKQRNKKHLLHLLTDNEHYNYHKISKEKLSDYEKQFQDDLAKLLPSRRKWKNLGEDSRYKNESKQKLSSIDKNIFSLLKTINYYRKQKPKEKFVIELNSFIKEIQDSIENTEYFISQPSIYPKPKIIRKSSELKEDEINTCRPIALFTLKDRIILSFTNRYLTQLFDEYFNSCSMAFRAPKIVNGKKEIISHHNAIQEIVKYKNIHKETPLWIAECDMKKFYDSVNHNIIIKLFESIIQKVKRDSPRIDISCPQRLFKKYLECYSFNTNVLPLNNVLTYWESYNIVKGEFGWVSNDSLFKKYYSDISNERIGIPQGGALSGLIANIVLDYADNKVIEDELFYVRFCDDMILMHPNKKKCKSKIDSYKKALEELMLVPHNFCVESALKTKRDARSKNFFEISLSPFWNVKSKGPYKWDEVNNGGFPWIGFVGYEMHFKGHIRVRKSSLLKEQKKQHEVINQIVDAVKKDKRVSNGTISESAIHRLIGMSVGRVELWNYSDIENEMCWKNGFQELNYNKYSIKQLKELDRIRSKLYYNLIEVIEKETEKERDNDEQKESLSRQIIAYNKPFSYYYQVVERGKISDGSE